MYAFLSRDRKVGQNAWYGDTFLSQAKTFCRGTERLGQKGWDRTSGTEGLGQNVSVPKKAWPTWVIVRICPSPFSQLFPHLNRSATALQCHFPN